MTQSSAKLLFVTCILSVFLIAGVLVMPTMLLAGQITAGLASGMLVAILLANSPI